MMLQYIISNLKSYNGLMSLKKFYVNIVHREVLTIGNYWVFIGTLDVTQHSYIYMHVEDGE